MSFRSLGSQKSNASNGVRFEVEMKELQPFDSTHGSLALKAYQQNLYLEYYY